MRMSEHARSSGSHGLTRRSILGQFFGAAAGFVLIGCGDAGESDPLASQSGEAPSDGESALSVVVVEVWRDPG